jgi:hypothetical protein
MGEFHFERQARTPYSEAYTIIEDGDRIGRVDIHFNQTTVDASLALVEDFDEGRIQDIIEVIDDELVLPTDVARDDFVVSVFIGREVGVFSDELLDDDLLDDEFEEEDDGGRDGDRP